MTKTFIYLCAVELLITVHYPQTAFWSAYILAYIERPTVTGRTRAGFRHRYLIPYTAVGLSVHAYISFVLIHFLIFQLYRLFGLKHRTVN